ncbi:MAG TPA: hypothetical protein VL069_16725 [Opitutus sp.]|nr:hypothetical protein [Opitutus sp.]
MIESASFQLTISPEATWDMTPAEEEAQRKANAAGLGAFMETASEALAETQEEASYRPQTEAEAEKLQAESDRLTDRVMARMQREGAAADYAKILAEEIERARRERGEPDLTPEQEAERDRRIDEMNAAAAEALESEKTDSWKRDGESAHNQASAFGQKHPLSARAMAFSLRILHEIEERGWENNDSSHEHPITVLMDGITSAGAKLAGALDGDNWPPSVNFCAGVIVRLKKAAGYLEDAKLAAESCRDEALVDATWLAEVARELEAIAAETDALITELRARLENGTS